MKRLTTTATAVAITLAASPSLPALPVSAGSSTAAPIDSSTRNLRVTADLEVVGGVYMNDHLSQWTTGREHQVRMTRALVGLGVKEGSWESRLELVVIGDEVYQDPDDTAYLDIYRNLGTDIYYYGDYPAREAWVGQDLDWVYWRAGRVINLMGERPGGRFDTAGESPNAVLLATGLFNGAQTGLRLADGWINLALGIMGGNDHPRLGANNYLDGKLDVNEKGNNTPVVEVYASLQPLENFRAYSGYLDNKTGSAPGSFESGKHNDRRLVYGVDYQPYKNDWVLVSAGAQGYEFTRGLTEKGEQGAATPVESYDIVQAGWFATLNLSFPTTGVSIRYTREEMDRMDPIAWRDIAGFDRNHPVNDARESRDIVSIEKAFASGFSLRVFYRQDEVPYLTGNDLELEDRAGLVFSYNVTL
ncbi:MAG: hypothetical protein ACQERE_02205 [Pseudomonadota bacterium]